MSARRRDRVLWEGATDEGYLRVRTGVERRLADNTWCRAHQAEAHECAYRVASENDDLRRIVADLHWMARRYADRRSSYAAPMFNEHTRTLLGLGVKLNATGDRTVWATDGMGRKFDGLTDEEATPGTPAAMGQEPQP